MKDLKNFLKTLILYIPIIGFISLVWLDYPSTKDEWYPISNPIIFWTSVIISSLGSALIVVFMMYKLIS